MYMEFSLKICKSKDSRLDEDGGDGAGAESAH